MARRPLAGQLILIAVAKLVLCVLVRVHSSDSVAALCSIGTRATCCSRIGCRDMRPLHRGTSRSSFAFKRQSFEQEFRQ